MIKNARKAKGKQWLAITVSTVAFGGLLFLFIDPSVLRTLAKELSAIEIISLACLYTATMALRIIRIRVAFSTHTAPTIPQLAYASVIHQFLNHIVPARLGELSLPILLNRRNQVPITRSVALLLAIRLFDLIVLLLFGFAALMFLLQNQKDGNLNISLTLSALCLALLLVCLSWYFFVYRFDLNSLGKRNSSSGRISNLLEKCRTFAIDIQDEIKLNWSPLKQFTVFSYSCLVWLSLLVFFHVFLRYASYEVAYWQTLVGSTFANLTQLLPINSLGSIGTLEAGWSAGFFLTGIPIRMGAATGLLMHALVITYLFSLAGLFKLIDLLLRKGAE